MSTSNFIDFKDLSEEEQILHHDAAMVKKDLQAYLESPSRGERTWKAIFKKHLVFPKLSTATHQAQNPLVDFNDLFCGSPEERSCTLCSPAAVEPHHSIWIVR
jgi:hypothetical protein